MEAWKNFKGEKWKQTIDVATFIKENYKEYKGDESFLQGPTEKTKKVWATCEKLFVKEVTVKSHLNSIFKKLHVENRTQAVLLAIQSDLLK